VPVDDVPPPLVVPVDVDPVEVDPDVDPVDVAPEDDPEVVPVEAVPVVVAPVDVMNAAKPTSLGVVNPVSVLSYATTYTLY
jgi:hypothetical protein